MSDEYEEGPDPFMVDLGESTEGNMNMLEESHRMESSQQMQSANSLAFELAAAFGSGGGSSPSKTQRKVVEEDQEFDPALEMDDEHLHTQPHSEDNEESYIDDAQLEEYNDELNSGIELNAEFLNKLKDIDSGLPMLESTATVVVKKLVETAKVRDDQSRQLWELYKELSKEEDWALAVLDPLDDKDDKDEDVNALNRIDEQEEDRDVSNDNDPNTQTQTENATKSSSIPSLEGFIDEYILQSLSMITEISQISTATLNESSRKTRSMRSTLSSIKSEDERTMKAKEVIDRLESKKKASLRQLMDNLQTDFLNHLNQLSEWVNVQGVSDC